MRVLVTGASGQLGVKLVQRLRRDGAEVFAAARHPTDTTGATTLSLDVTDRAATLAVLERARPDLVIHAAAMADVDACERQPELAEAVNARGTAHVSAAAEQVGARLVAVSTDYVFDGEAGPYSEVDTTHPLSVYARTKLAGEQAALSHPNAAVARTAVLFGWYPGSRSNVVLWLLERLACGEPAAAAVDQWGNPTLTDNLADLLVELAHSGRRGVYHAAGARIRSRYELAREAAEVFGFDPTLVQPIESASIPRPARRPRHVGLLLDKLRRDVPSAEPLPSRAALEALRGQLAASPAAPFRAFAG